MDKALEILFSGNYSFYFSLKYMKLFIPNQNNLENSETKILELNVLLKIFPSLTIDTNTVDSYVFYCNFSYRYYICVCVCTSIILFAATHFLYAVSIFCHTIALRRFMVRKFSIFYCHICTQRFIYVFFVILSMSSSYYYCEKGSWRVFLSFLVGKK